MSDIIYEMKTNKDNIRYKKIIGAKILKEAGFYDEMLEDIVEMIISGETENAKNLPEELNLHKKQIEQFQKETRLRVSLSFYAAIVAMFLGFGLIFCAVCHVLVSGTHLIPVTIIATISGAISTFIVKTFFEMHYLSLQQLGHYSEKSVIYTYILMAQLLANNIPESITGQRAYEAIIRSLTSLINDKSGRC